MLHTTAVHEDRKCTGIRRHGKRRFAPIIMLNQFIYPCAGPSVHPAGGKRTSVCLLPVSNYHQQSPPRLLRLRSLRCRGGRGQTGGQRGVPRVAGGMLGLSYLDSFSKLAVGEGYAFARWACLRDTPKRFHGEGKTDTLQIQR